jgi:protease I
MKLEGKKIAVLLAEGFEDLEYWVTVMRLREEGAEVVTVGPSTDAVGGKNASKRKPTRPRTGSRRGELDGVVIPGRLGARQAAGATPRSRPRKDGPRAGQDGGHYLHGGLVAISAGIVSGAGPRAPRHQGRPGERRSYLGGQGGLRDGNLVWGRVVPRHPGLLPRARRRPRGRVEKAATPIGHQWRRGRYRRSARVGGGLAGLITRRHALSRRPPSP